MESIAADNAGAPVQEGQSMAGESMRLSEHQTEDTAPPAATEAAGGAGGSNESDTSSKANANPAENGNDAVAASGEAIAAGEAKMSKNQLRKLKRKAMWEDQRDDRKRKRKDKRHEKQARKREEKAAAIAEAEAAGIDPKTLFQKHDHTPPVRVPVGIILDCDFEKYMLEGELISLASQITRSYSDNKKSRFQTHLYASSYGGKMKERFEGILQNQHEQWKHIKFVEEDFVEVAKAASEAMKEDKVVEVLKAPTDGKPAMVIDLAGTTPQPEPEAEPAEDVRNIVYLSSDSPYTLDRLEPNTCYIVGGLVDKNREKGLCHRRARERGIRTAKLPIGEYLEMASRRVLATNHVVEIMLRWLELGDWGKAFMEVMPKRKGGRLRGTGEAETADSSLVEDSRLEEDAGEEVDLQETLAEGVPLQQEADPTAEKTS